jgi:tRNA(fMet)-specific endonuclease VapC
MVSYILKRRSPAVLERLNGLRRDEKVFLSSLTEAELRYGYVRAGVGPDRFRALDLFLERFEVLPWDRLQTRTYALLRTQQESLGRTLSALDLLIAAHAISINAILVTHDEALKSVESLTGVEDWATDL